MFFDSERVESQTSISFMAASRRRGPYERLRRVLSVYVVGALVGAAPAAAADLPASHCALDRAPVLDWLRLAKGDDCPFDEDGNGLDDRVETALARCFVPEITFDSRENALAPDEPHVVFSADPVGPRVIRLHFAILFARDGGYVLGTEFPCLSDEHNGDSESVTVDVVWLERDRGWYGAPLSMHTPGPDGVEERTALSGATADASSGTHPRLYATAGKHHWLHHTASLAYACNCGPFGRCGSVRDRADGAGARIVPTSLRHAPRFAWREAPTAGPTSEAPRARLLPLAPLDALTARAASSRPPSVPSGPTISAISDFPASVCSELAFAEGWADRVSRRFPSAKRWLGTIRLPLSLGRLMSALVSLSPRCSASLGGRQIRAR